MGSNTYLLIIVLLLIVIFLTTIATNIKQELRITTILCLLCILFLMILLYGENKNKELYDYDRENPNALIQGKNIAGTVFTKYPNNVPGLGWI